MSHLKKLALGLGTAIFLTMFTLALNAQSTMAKQDNTAMGKKMSATGCLNKGTSADGYYLKGDDGKTYELWGDKYLSKHVGHKVTVTGEEEKMPESMEKNKETTEKTEAAGQPQMDLKVSHVKMVSESCP